MNTVDTALFTIDEPHSRDLDDAIGVARTDTGWTVRVAIANPSAVVPIGSNEDAHARAQGATIYRGPTATKPMLPRSISQEQSTLTAGAQRAAMLIDLSIDRSGGVLGTALSFGHVTVSRRLSYKDVPAIAQNKSDELHAPISDAIGIAKSLLQQRRARGSLAVFDPSRFLLTDEEGRLQFFDVSEMAGHLLVQEVMIAANAAVAAFAATNNIPFLFRSHEPRISSPRGAAATASFDAWIAGGHATAAAAAERLSLVAQKARYSNLLTGHYALSLPAYAHVTSPLRRYADLVVQRQLAAFLDGRALPYTQDELGVIGDELFAVAQGNIDAATDFFKAPVVAKAQAAIDGNYALRALADNELSQAVKLGLANGFAQPLVDELARRMRSTDPSDKLADKVALRLFEGRSGLPPDLSQAFVAMLAEQPSRAMSLVNSAISTGEVAELDVQITEAGGGFTATASMLDVRRGRAVRGLASDGRKKGAEQAAVLLALCELMDVPRPTNLGVEKTSPKKSAAVPGPPVPAGNPKGALLELCQKRRLLPPIFSTSVSGPSNAPTFVCECSLVVAGKTLKQQSAGAPTKKHAEALASSAMLDALGS